MNTSPQEIPLEKIVTIVYTNWKGVTAVRQIFPVRVFFGNNEWHKENQWLLEAIDLEKNATRTFAMKDIRSWFIQGK